MTKSLRASLAAALILTLAMTGAEAARRHKPVPKPAPEATKGQIVARLVDWDAVVPLKNVRAAWTQYGPGGALEARAIVDGYLCPKIAIDLKQKHMESRVTADEKFPTICSVLIPTGTKQVALVLYHANLKSPPPGPSAGEADIRDWIEQENGAPVPASAKDLDERYAALSKRDLIPLPVPIADPQRIVVFGDTGCRIKGKSLQDCRFRASLPRRPS
jgi:hypothetical protein